MQDVQLFSIDADNILTDSGVYATDHNAAYERVVIVKGWHLNRPKAMARITVKVHRQPSRSVAKAEVWAPEKDGWAALVERNPYRFWGKMPGADRAGSPETVRLTMRLFEDIFNEVAILAELGSLDRYLDA